MATSKYHYYLMRYIVCAYLVSAKTKMKIKAMTMKLFQEKYKSLSANVLCDLRERKKYTHNKNGLYEDSKKGLFIQQIESELVIIVVCASIRLKHRTFKMFIFFYFSR